MDKYLQLLEEKRQNAKIYLQHWKVRRYIPTEYTDEAIERIIGMLQETINTYTDCIELYKIMQSKNDEVLEIIKEHCCEWFEGNIHDEERFSFIVKIFGEPNIAKKVKEWLEDEND